MKKSQLILTGIVVLAMNFVLTSCGNNATDAANAEQEKIKQELLKKLSTEMFDVCYSSPIIIRSPYQEVKGAYSKGGIYFDGESGEFNVQQSYYDTQLDAYQNHFSWETMQGKIDSVKFKEAPYSTDKKIPMLVANWKSNDGNNTASIEIVPILYQEKDEALNGAIQYNIHTKYWSVFGNRFVSQDEFYAILNLMGKLSGIDVSGLKITGVNAQEHSSQTATTAATATAESGQEAVGGEALDVVNTRLSREQLSEYSKDELRLLRNEIYARHGYIFKAQDLKNHFSQQAWYKPERTDVNSMLSAIEKENIKLIESLEK